MAHTLDQLWLLGHRCVYLLGLSGIVGEQRVAIVWLAHLILEEILHTALRIVHRVQRLLVTIRRLRVVYTLRWLRLINCWEVNEAREFLHRGHGVGR